MSRQHNTSTVLGALAICLATLACPRLSGAAQNQLTPAQLLDVFARIDARLTARSIEDETFPSVAGVNVEVRSGGALMAMSVAIAPQSGPGTSPGVIARASERVRERFRDRAPLSGDLLEGERLEALRSLTTLSVEIAGPLTPMSPKSWADVVATLTPGLDGVAVRTGGADGRIAAVFPGRMLSEGWLPSEAIQIAASEAIGAPVPMLTPAEIAERHGVTFFRFRAQHVAQAQPGEPPRFLDRGGELVRFDGAFNRDTLVRMAVELSAHLAGSVSSLEDPLGTALVSVSLGRAAEALERVGETQRSRAAHRVSRDLTRGIKPPFARPVTAAAAVVAVAELGPMAGGELTALANTAADRVRLAYSEADGFSDDAFVSTHAIIAYALTRRAELIEEGVVEGDPREAWAVAGSATKRVLANTNAGVLVAHAPWIGWADLLVAQNDDRLDVATGVFDQMRDEIWRHQLTEADCGPEEQDMLGGIVFTAAAVPAPTWHTARPVAWLATALREPRLTAADERPYELIRVLKSVRFLRQLQVRQAETWAMERPTRALGGVRSSLWDWDQPASASAMTLLAVSELLISLDEMQKAPSP